MDTRVLAFEAHCWFCRAARQDREFLIAGPMNVMICNQCVAICVEIIAEARSGPLPSSPEASPTQAPE